MRPSNAGCRGSSGKGLVLAALVAIALGGAGWVGSVDGEQSEPDGTPANPGSTPANPGAQPPNGAPPTGGTTEPPGVASSLTGAMPLRRLTRLELVNTLGVLLGVAVQVPD